MVVAEYADQAITGAVLDSRPAVQDLLTHAEDGEFDAVLIEDLSRISRDQADVATIHKLLAFHDVALVSVTEGEIGALHIGLKGTMNSLHLKDLSDKVRRGQYAAVRNGRIPGGRIYGLETVRYVQTDGSVTTGRRRIDPKEAEVVRRIFNEAAAGRETRKIAAGLNRDGIPSPRGKKWAAATILGDRPRGSGLLRQPLYIGRVIFGRWRTHHHPVTGRRVLRQQPRSAWVVVDVPHLAIVPREQFKRVQEILDAQGTGRRDAQRRENAARASTKASRPPRYLTSGCTWCASCGGRVTSAHTNYIVCRAWKEHRACTQRHLFRRDAVIRATLDYLVSPRCKNDIHTACREFARSAERQATAVLLVIENTTDLAERIESELGVLSASVAKHVGMARVREHAATCDTINLTLRDSIQRLRLATTGTLPVLKSRRIANACHARAAAAVTRTRAGTATPDDDDLLRLIIETIHVAWRGPGRSNLDVRPVISAAAAYHHGLAEVAPDLLRGTHGTHPAAAAADHAAHLASTARHRGSS